MLNWSKFKSLATNFLQKIELNMNKNLQKTNNKKSNQKDKIKERKT